MTLEFRALGADLDDEEARKFADQFYALLVDAGVDVEGVAPVLNEDVVDRGHGPIADGGFREEGPRREEIASTRSVADTVREQFSEPSCSAACDEPAEVATPAGPMCSRHASELAEDLVGDHS